jgi:uncharacterized protein (DUF1330 family)
MPAYVVVDIHITDTEKFEKYRQAVPRSIAQYGGRYIVRGGKTETLEGAWNPERIVVLEFPSLEQAKAWYESAEYAAPKALRHACARSNIILVEGM